MCLQLLQRIFRKYWIKAWHFTNTYKCSDISSSICSSFRETHFYLFAFTFHDGPNKNIDTKTFFMMRTKTNKQWKRIVPLKCPDLQGQFIEYSSMMEDTMSSCSPALPNTQTITRLRFRLILTLLLCRVSNIPIRFM